MKLHLLLVHIFVTLNIAWAFVIKEAPFSSCETAAFPPNASVAAPQYTINLDLPDTHRWTALATKKKHDILKLTEHVKDLVKMVAGVNMYNFLLKNLNLVFETLPNPYKGEISGIAAATGVPASEVTLYNIFYEVFTVCTSIIVQHPSGSLYHGRNLDFGLFMGWDSKNHTWRVAELLKPLVVQLQWVKGGVEVYQSVSYAGYVGTMTAVKKGKFTFSFDERFGINGGFMGLLEWIIFKDYSQKWCGFLAREVMEKAESYKEAEQMLSLTRLLAPVYFILGGVNPGEGVIITRWRDNYRSTYLADNSTNNRWFLVETNYDQWKTPPFFDDRRTPAINCLKSAGQPNASPQLIYNVLSTRPVLNKLTTYTSLMEVRQGSMGAWLRSCDDPCWPW